VYDLAEQLGVEVWFDALPSLEGMYSKTPRPVIVLSSLRPPGRKTYTGGHELGHHVFGHGFRIDQYLADGPLGQYEDDEFLVDCFSGFLLMSKAAVERAFSERQWNPTTATPAQFYTVAGWLGVGYETLLFHMRANLGLLTSARERSLGRVAPKTIRADLLGTECPEHLVVADTAWADRAIDIQAGDYVLCPRGTVVEGSCAAVTGGTLTDTVARGISPGLGRLVHPGVGWASFIRVSRQGFTGRARFRHEPEVEE
jgi:hypothetical protein